MPGRLSFPLTTGSRHAVFRAAFTLLEVLLALGLSVVLLVALNSALDLYRRFTTAGRADIEQAQLVRALMQKMQADIRCAVSPPESSIGGFSTSSTSSSGGSSSSTTSSSSSSSTSSDDSQSSSGTGDDTTAPEPIEVVDPSAAYSKEVVGLLGDPSSLVLTVARPTRSNGFSATLGGPASISDLKSVSYFFVQQGAEGLRGIVATQWAETGTAVSSTGEVAGLARLEGDRLAISKADEEADLETLAGRTQLLSPEVSHLQFRYSDGLLWYDTWDSTSAGLPRAVEITLGFAQTNDAAAQTVSTQNTDISGETYRLVVAIPSSQPLTTMDGL